jgi:hypothetical protein
MRLSCFWKEYFYIAPPFLCCLGITWLSSPKLVSGDWLLGSVIWFMDLSTASLIILRM